MNHNIITFLITVFVLQITVKGLTQQMVPMQQYRYISGRITDAEDKEPIPGVSVFIANTTFGITTDLDGVYRFQIPREGSYRLTISHVGYQSVFMDIEPGISAIKFDVAMQSVELDELNVVKRIRFRQSDINLFWKTILGKNPSRRTIQATNPEAAYYYYNPETRILKVLCREPLQIINHETGYQIHYVLENFTHNYNTDVTEWNYQPKFTELKPENDRQKASWEKKRKEVYDVSLTKLVKALYHNSLKEDGFVLAVLRKTYFGRNPFQIASLTPDKFISTNPNDNSKILNLTNLSNEQVMLVCYGKPVNDFDLIALQEAINVSGKWASSGLFRNLLSGGMIRFFPDGTFTSQINMTPMDVSDPINGLTYLLPIDYQPDSSTFLNSTDNLAENMSDFDRVAQQFDRQLSVFPQEKIHLHTDRDVYVSGEKIWFKAYITDAHTHQYPTQSRYMYVELISSVDTLMHRVMIQQANGMFYGHLPLTAYIPTGNYTLRAYTRYMENLGDDYFFKKNIRIENLKTPINRQRPIASRGMLKDDFRVSFFPEGGNLLEGVLNKIAFKALNINGYPENVSGKLVDENGIELTSVETFYAGMGVFEYIPEAKKKIFLKCKNVNGLEKQFELPQPSSVAYSLAAYRYHTDLLIEINRAVQAPDMPCFLLAHCRGNVLYFAKWDSSSHDISFSEEEFPAGIIQFVLFDEQMNPLSERLVFNKNYTNDVSTIEFRTDKTSYQKRDKVIASLSLTSSTSDMVGEGHLSISITDDKDMAIISSTTILSSLLLSSELKGYIENPAFYLQDNLESTVALDYLMLTHGWKRYEIPAIINGNPKHPNIRFQLNQDISGKVKNLIFSGGVSDAEIIMMSKDEGVRLTSTDENGLFTFQDFEFPDSASFTIQALSKKGSDRVEIVVDKEVFPKPVYAIQSPFTETPLVRHDQKNDSESNPFLTKAEQRARYDEDMWMIQLDEVEVTARRIDRRDDTRLQFWANAGADVTLRREDIEKRNFQFVSDYLVLMPSVRVSFEGEITIRGPRSTGSTRPLILVNGIALEWPDHLLDSKKESPLEQIMASEIESIDLFTGTSAVAFGVRGANGVISITTRRGANSRFFDKANIVIYNPLGYQKPVEFYAPVYETLESKYLTVSDYRTTIFWKPDIVILNAEETVFEFYTSDFPTTYSVVIEGLTTDGRIVRHVEKIRVE